MSMLVEWEHVNQSTARGPSDKSKVKFQGFSWNAAKRILFEIVCFVLGLEDGEGSRKRPLTSNTTSETNKRYYQYIWSHIQGLS